MLKSFDIAIKEGNYFDAWLIFISMAMLTFLALILIAMLVISMKPRIVECDTDLDCHQKNPGVCKEDEPYCI